MIARNVWRCKNLRAAWTICENWKMAAALKFWKLHGNTIKLPSRSQNFMPTKIYMHHVKTCKKMSGNKWNFFASSTMGLMNFDLRTFWKIGRWHYNMTKVGKFAFGLQTNRNHRFLNFSLCCFHNWHCPSSIHDTLRWPEATLKHRGFLIRLL